MDIYHRLPNELQTIIKYYTLCSPHTFNSRNYTWKSSIDSTFLKCNHNNRETNLVYTRHTYYYSVREGDELPIYFPPQRMTLLWNYETCRRSNMIYFIQNNISTRERNWLCKNKFHKSFKKLNISQLIWLRRYVYYCI